MKRTKVKIEVLIEDTWVPFSGLVRSKRGRRGVRTAAKECGVSASTISRLENGWSPDLANYGRICDWLGLQFQRVREKSGSF